MATVFDDLVGQEDAVAILQGASLAARNGDATQEMTHAWIFTGPQVQVAHRLLSHSPNHWFAHKVAVPHVMNVAAQKHMPTPMLRS